MYLVSSNYDCNIEALKRRRYFYSPSPRLLTEIKKSSGEAALCSLESAAIQLDYLTHVVSESSGAI